MAAPVRSISSTSTGRAIGDSIVRVQLLPPQRRRRYTYSVSFSR
jgi:hypothetical protein